ncbi:MAG: WG repeat-containing protein, partial [Proteobacteria bacterium]|nr:WG repeat-containing protein [Pseudomonadota bacterium]
MKYFLYLICASILVLSGCDRANADESSQIEITDKTGKFVINPQFDNAYGFSQGLARVIIRDNETGKYGFIDKTGKMV